MPIPLYLAMTGGEFFCADRHPEKIAWMACHFSCYGTGLSNLPQSLPEGSLIIVNDRMPPDRHDPQRILEQLQQLGEHLKPAGFLLDFQRPGIPFNQKLSDILTEGLSFPVGVSDTYAGEGSYPVFLSQPQLHIPLQDALAPWDGREIWLEAALQTQCYTLTTAGCVISDAPDTLLAEPAFDEPTLFCKYHISLSENEAIFTLQRAKKELDALLQNAEGVALAVGLYQQLG